jgi:glycosyltransferase involved in cell wall biosynthesis
VKAGKPKLLWFGRVSAQKKFGDFLELVRLATNSGVIESASVAGDFDPDSFGLKNEAKLMGINLLGHVGDVSELLRDDWVVCLFSHFEGRPFSLEEAMEAGLPVIASDLPGNAMMIYDKRVLVNSPSEAAVLLVDLQLPAAREQAGRKLRDDMRRARSRVAYEGQISGLYARLTSKGVR